jgi:hypothetical protein
MDADANKPVQTCKDCIHFFVTYDPQFPYGCRSMGFKSRRYPCFEVQEASGEPCQGREVKKVIPLEQERHRRSL